MLSGMKNKKKNKWYPPYLKDGCSMNHNIKININKENIALYFLLNIFLDFNFLNNKINIKETKLNE